MKKYFSLLLLLIGFAAQSCIGLQKDMLLKGEWTMDFVKLNGGELNFLEELMPDYVSGKGKYLVYFEDGGVCRGEYYANNVPVYVVNGT